MLVYFQYMFFKRHGYKIGTRYLDTWHTEISAIVLAATAGFILVNGILFPGTYNRLLFLSRGFKDATKVLICLFLFYSGRFFEKLCYAFKA